VKLAHAQRLQLLRDDVGNFWMKGWRAHCLPHSSNAQATVTRAVAIEPTIRSGLDICSALMPRG